MRLLLFDRLPAWMPGCYGGVVTPAIDSVAATASVADFAFITDPPSVVAAGFEARRHPGVPSDLSEIPLNNPGRLNELVSQGDWDELVELWREDGFEFDADDLTPGDLPDLLADTPDLLSDDLRYESDAAATIASAIERLHLSDADAWVSQETAEVGANAPLAITAVAGGTPLPRPDEPLLDIARHVPLIVRSSDADGRLGGLIDASRFLRTGAVELADRLEWSDTSGQAIRVPTELVLREERSDGTTVRRFRKPDDRFCQLNVARPGESAFEPAA